LLFEKGSSERIKESFLERLHGDKHDKRFTNIFMKQKQGRTFPAIMSSVVAVSEKDNIANMVFISDQSESYNMINTIQYQNVLLDGFMEIMTEKHREGTALDTIINEYKKAKTEVAAKT
ncbi:MAG: hypothetical protein AAB875_07000, partial [Patescibacteria group bacterium]